jgi:hypothetical protein
MPSGEQITPLPGSRDSRHPVTFATKPQLAQQMLVRT